MSARTCLLCGKTLSRIWAGSGEDFCSREHRNQYRLRRGMDRLMEANKVSSVMRRRENPRPMDASLLIRGGLETPRDYSQPQAFQPPAAGLPRLAPSSRPRLAGGGPLQPPAAMGGGAGLSRRDCPAPLPVRSAAAVMLLPARALHARPQAAPPMALAHGVGLAAGPGREMAVPLPLPAAESILRGLRRPTAGSGVLAKSRPARPLNLAHGGRDLRVSMAARFRVPDWKLRSIAFAPAVAGFKWPAPPPKVAAVRSPSGPGYLRPRTGPAAITTAAIKPEGPALRVPALPPPNSNGGFHWPGIMDFPPLIVISAIHYRVPVVPFGEENPTKERFHEYRN